MSGKRSILVMPMFSKSIFSFFFFLVCSCGVFAQDSLAFRFSVGFEVDPEWSWFKTSQRGHRRPDLLPYPFSGGRGWGGIVTSGTAGLRANYIINTRLSVSAGLKYGKRGGRLEFTDSVIVYAYGNTVVPVSEVDSNYLNAYPEYKNCLLRSRKYESHYVLIPLGVRVNILPLKKVSFHLLAGAELQLRTGTVFEDTYGVWEDTLSRYDGYIYVKPKLEQEMKSLAVSAFLGAEWQFLLGEKLIFTQGWHISRGLTNPVQRYSLYNMDKALTDAGFSANGEAVAREQRFHMNSFGISLGLHYRL